MVPALRLPGPLLLGAGCSELSPLRSFRSRDTAIGIAADAGAAGVAVAGIQRPAKKSCRSYGGKLPGYHSPWISRWVWTWTSWTHRSTSEPPPPTRVNQSSSLPFNLGLRSHFLPIAVQKQSETFLKKNVAHYRLAAPIPRSQLPSCCSCPAPVPWPGAAPALPATPHPQTHESGPAPAPASLLSNSSIRIILVIINILSVEAAAPQPLHS